MNEPAAERRVLVLGGSGAVGREVSARLAAGSVRVTAAARRPPGDLAGVTPLPLDVRDAAALAAALSEAAVVVDATGLDDPAVAMAAVRARVDLVDISADRAHLEWLGTLDADARGSGSRLVGWVGLAPGLTTLLAEAVAAALLEAQPVPGGASVQVTTLFGLGEAHGVSATRWLLDQLASAPPAGVRRAARVGVPGRRSPLGYSVDFGEPATVGAGVPVASRCVLDPPLLGSALATLMRVPGAPALFSRSAGLAGALLPHDRWTLVATASGAGPAGEVVASATGRGQNAGTATVTAWAVELLFGAGLAAGAHPLGRFTDLAAARPALAAHDISITLPA